MQNVEKELKKELDQHVKELHRMLHEMDPQSRLEYIKEILPSLLTFSHPNSSAQEKLQASIQSPLQNLTQHELNLIDDLAKKTENLYKAMNDGSYFG
ncbi:MAG: hypothetical protein ABI772_06825 [Bacteroidota bacterium]